MRKILSTLVLACSTLLLSAQISLMSDINSPEEGDNWNISNFTNNIGIGYQIDDKIMIGLKKDSTEYLIVGRYNLNSNLYISLETTEEFNVDNFVYGIGYSVKVWNNLYIQPEYILRDDEGEVKIGMAYKF